MEIVGFGMYVPEKVVTNDDFVKYLDTSDEWITTRTGIKNRHFINYEEEKNRDLAIAAAKQAIADANINVEDIAVCVVATFTPDYLTPSVACMVSRSLCLSENALCFDLNAACSGYLYSLQTATQLLKAYPNKYALVIGSEVVSRVTDLNDRNTAILFGDGAGATVIKSNPEKEYSFVAGNRPDEEVLYCDHKEMVIKMKGQDVYRFATEVANKSIKELLEKNNLTIDDISYIVPHQANYRIVETISRKLKMDMSKFYVNLHKYGNTSSASIPLALCEMKKENLLHSGDKIICVAFGGGLTYGATLITI